MLTFIPKDNTGLGEEFLPDNDALGYIAYDDGGKECGKIAFHLNGYSMEIIYIFVPDGDGETYEGLIRSALNYCGNRNAYVAYYCESRAVDIAKNLGFEQKEDRLYGEIPFLLQGSCCKGSLPGKENL